jgi:methyl-accepting chemotaxis protein
MQDALRSQADAQRLAAELKDQDHAKQIARRQRIEQQIADFRSSIGNMLGQVKEVVERMNSTAQTLSTISIDADHRAKEATGNAEGASVDVASVAASTEQLEASIREITRRLTPASASISRTTEMVQATNEMIGRLAEAAKRIGDVVGLIRSIAEHTNLLALNATIEAARAGGAGRGFAVVASEVKALATETAKATEEISGQVSAVQSSTIQAVEQIKSIASVMTEINYATMEITVAVQQQGTATEEIARSIHSAASSTKNVARNILETTTAIGETNNAAVEGLDAATYLTSHTSNLRESVDQFLREVAAA